MSSAFSLPRLLAASPMDVSPEPSRRICPLLEQESPAVRLADAPQPWDLRQCSTSGFVFLANPPAQERFCEEFAWEKTHALESLDRRHREPLVHAVSQVVKRFRQRVLRRDKVAAVVGQLVAGRCDRDIRLVDIGCAAGDLLERLVKRVPASGVRRIEPIGIEISTQLAARADAALRARGGRCIHATGADGLAQLPPSSVDIIVLSCVLEHEIAPLPLLRACRERLAGDGRIVVKVPNYDCVSRRLRGSRWCGYRWPDHVNYFTPRTLTAMAGRAGFRVVRMDFADRWPLSDSLYAILGNAAHAALSSDAT